VGGGDTGGTERFATCATVGPEPCGHTKMPPVVRTFGWLMAPMAIIWACWADVVVHFSRWDFSIRRLINEHKIKKLVIISTKCRAYARPGLGPDDAFRRVGSTCSTSD